MQLQAIQTAIVKCSKTGQQYEIDPHIMDIELDHINDREMGPENVYDCIVYHAELGEIFWRVWEYPREFINHIESSLGNNEEIKPPMFKFVEEKPLYISGQAVIQSATNGKEYKIDASEVKIESAMLNSGIPYPSNLVFLCTVEHPQLGKIYWEIWSELEYKDGYIQYYLNGNNLIKDFQFKYNNLDIEIDSISHDKTQPIVDWFFKNYENPVNSVPYESKEGGFLWPLHDTYDVISNQFTNIPEMILQVATNRSEELEGGITEWTEKIKDEYLDKPIISESRNLFFSGNELSTLNEFIDTTENLPTSIQVNITQDNKIDISEKSVDCDNHSFALFKSLQEITKKIKNICDGLQNSHGELVGFINGYYNYSM